ncbi:MAG: hypothetical protein IPF99_19955 [Deltaproteobacteria bacterium]|nr:hypothetical protein [Deltaproteobacteria bacterium]
MLITSRSSVLLCLLAVAGCATTAATTAPTSPPTAGAHAFVVAPMTLVPSTPIRSPCLAPTALQADGRAVVGDDHVGRIEHDRVVTERGEVILQLAPDGTVALPWSTSATGFHFRFTPQGLELVTSRGSMIITIDAVGAYSRDGTPTGARLTPYAPAHRDTALLLCMLPAIVADRIITIGRSAAGRPAR